MNKDCCRICLSGNESQLVELFWVDGGVTYADKVKFCSGVEIMKRDQLPQKICFDCSDNIRSACDIKTKCIETDRLLRRQLKSEPFCAKIFDDLSVFCLPVLGDTQDAKPDPSSLQDLKRTEVPVKTEVSSDDDNDCDVYKVSSSESDDVSEVKTRSSNRSKVQIKSRKAVYKICQNCGGGFEKIARKSAADITLCRSCEKARDRVEPDLHSKLLYKCLMCSKSFQFKSQLKKHEETIHANKTSKPIACDICEFSTNDKTRMQEHIHRNHETNDVNSFSVFNNSSPEKHSKMVLNGLKRLSGRQGRPEDKLCLFCGSVFSSVSKRMAHLREKHFLELECKTCNAKKPSVFSVETCMKTHLFGHRYLCTVCAKGFSKESHLKRHERQVHFKNWNIGKVYYCDLCGHETKRKECIREHVQRHTKAGNKKFPCPHESCAGIAYSLLNALNRHLYLNHGVVAPLTCNLCGTGFTYQFEVTKHLKHCSGVSGTPRVTTRVKKDSLYEFFRVLGDKFHCKLCLRVFDTEEKFNFHYNSFHRDGKTCNICGKSFKSIDHRNKHIKIIHNKIKDYHCEHPGCGKSFGTIFVLQEHQNTHTGLRPFPCSYCDFSAASRSTQYKHIRRKHKLEMQRDQERSTSTFQRFP